MTPRLLLPAALVVWVVSGCEGRGAAPLPPAATTPAVTTPTTSATEVATLDPAPSTAALAPTSTSTSTPAPTTKTPAKPKPRSTTGCAARALAAGRFDPTCPEYQGYLDPGSRAGRGPTSGEVQTRWWNCKEGLLPKSQCP